MRVLQVLSTLNVGSGIANFVMNYYRKMNHTEIQFDFLLFGHVEKEYCEEVEQLGGRIYFIERPTVNFLDYSHKIHTFFKKHSGEWEILHIHEILVQRFLIRKAKKQGRVKKIITHSHASKFVLPNPSFNVFKNKITMLVKMIRNKILLKGIAKHSDVRLACSNSAGIALYGRQWKNRKAQKFLVMKNAIDTDKYIVDRKIREEYRKAFGISNKKVILCVGRLCAEKNQMFMIDILNEIRKMEDSYVLMLAGDGELRKAIEDKVHNLGLTEHVIFTGNRTDIEKLYQCCDVSVLPSLSEGLGIVLIEAQASGMPCITSTGVPQEVNISPYIQFLDLSKGALHWANSIKQMDIQRYSSKIFLIQSGYDITQNVVNLKNIYFKLLEN